MDISHEKRKLRIDDLKKFEYVSWPEWNGDEITYVVKKWDVESGKAIPQVEILDKKGNSARILHPCWDKKVSCWHPLFSPDGKKLAFLCDASGSGQLWICEKNGDKMRKLTSMQHGVTDFCWAPNGKYLAFTAPLCEEEREAARAKSSLSEVWKAEIYQEMSDEEAKSFSWKLKHMPKYITELMYKLDSAKGVVDGSKSQIGVLSLEVEKDSIKILTDGRFAFSSPVFSPDSSKLFFHGRPYGQYHALKEELFCTLPAKQSGILQLTHDCGFQGSPVIFTKDGKHLLTSAATAEADMEFNSQLCSLTADGSEFKSLFQGTADTFDGIASIYVGITENGEHRCPYQLSADGKFVYFLSAVHGSQQLFRYRLEDALSTAGQGSIEQVTDLPYSVTDFCLPKDGSVDVQILLLLTDDTTPVDMYLYDSSTQKLERLTSHNEWLKDVALSVPEMIFLEPTTSQSDITEDVDNTVDKALSMPVQGWVMPPVGMQMDSGEAHPAKDRKYPSFHYIHGGPEAYYAVGFDFECQAMAAMGLAVIYCNPRGSAGYGPDFVQGHLSYDGTAYKDLCNFTDLALDTFAWLDPVNVCIGGGSHGGWMTNYICCHTDRFKAAVDQRTWSNPSTSYGTGDMGFYSQSTQGAANFQEYMYNRARNASMVGIDHWKTPCLVLHGQNDYRCTLEQGEQIYSALRDRCPDVPRRMVIFPGENHGITRTGLLHWQLGHLQEMINWCLKYTAQENLQKEAEVSAKSSITGGTENLAATEPLAEKVDKAAIFPSSETSWEGRLYPFHDAVDNNILSASAGADQKNTLSVSGAGQNGELSDSFGTQTKVPISAIPGNISDIQLPVMEDYLKMQAIGQPAVNGAAGLYAWTQSFQPVPEKLYTEDHTGRFREQIHMKCMDQDSEWILTAGGQEEHSPFIADDGTVYFLSDASLPLPYPAVGTFEDRTVNEFFSFSQLYVRRKDDTCSKLTSMLHGVKKYQVSPDQSAILLQCWQYDKDSLSDMVKERTGQEVRKSLSKRTKEPIVCNGNYFKSDEESGYQSRRHQSLWLLRLTDHTLTCLLDKENSFHAPVFTPDGSGVIFARASKKGLLEWWHIPLTKPYSPEKWADLTNVGLCYEAENPPLFDEEGSVMVFPGVEPGSDYADPRGLYTLPWRAFPKDSNLQASMEMMKQTKECSSPDPTLADGSSADLLTTANKLIDPAYDVDGILPQEYNFASRSTGHLQYLVMPDGFCYYISGLEGRMRLFRVPIAGKLHKPQELIQKEDTSFNFQGLCALKDHQLLTMASDAVTLPELYLVSIESGSCALYRLTDTNPLLHKKRLQKPLELTVTTLDHADSIQGFTLPPADLWEASAVSESTKENTALTFQNATASLTSADSTGKEASQEKQKYPAILYCHGGPTGFYSTALNYEFQALAAAGFVVLFANPRGGTGYGKQHNSYEHAFDNTAMNDLLCFVREACRKYSFIDPDRIGICGGSYGGYMTAWAASHSKLFKAACAHRPLLNLQMIRYSSHSAGQDSREDFESFRDSMFDCIRNSPNTYADRITIPFQILQSEHDANCVPEQAHQLYTALKDLHPDIPSRLVLYPDSNHGLLKKGPAYLALQHRLDNLSWFQKYL